MCCIYRKDECDRVKMLGARVLTLDQVYGVKDPTVDCWGTEEEDGGDPPRLWAPTGNFPGTAFTRSIGDNGEFGICASAVQSVWVMQEAEGRSCCSFSCTC